VLYPDKIGCINESVKRLEAIQEQQHRIIEMLSARSIEQEAALKRIK
jgi:hypothetical protein